MREIQELAITPQPEKDTTGLSDRSLMLQQALGMGQEQIIYFHGPGKN